MTRKIILYPEIKVELYFNLPKGWVDNDGKHVCKACMDLADFVETSYRVSALRPPELPRECERKPALSIADWLWVVICSVCILLIAGGMVGQITGWW